MLTDYNHGEKRPQDKAKKKVVRQILRPQGQAASRCRGIEDAKDCGKWRKSRAGKKTLRKKSGNLFIYTYTRLPGKLFGLFKRIKVSLTLVL